MPSPSIEIAVTGVQNRRTLSGLLLSLLAAKNKAKNKTARIQNKGKNTLSSKPPTTAAKPVALELLSAKNSPGPSRPINTPANALSMPRRIAMGSPRGIATVGILLRERDFMDSCCKIAITLIFRFLTDGPDRTLTESSRNLSAMA
jgi:hypothetical protein